MGLFISVPIFPGVRVGGRVGGRSRRRRRRGRGRSSSGGGGQMVLGVFLLLGLIGLAVKYWIVTLIVLGVCVLVAALKALAKPPTPPVPPPRAVTLQKPAPAVPAAPTLAQLQAEVAAAQARVDKLLAAQAPNTPTSPAAARPPTTPSAHVTGAPRGIMGTKRRPHSTSPTSGDSTPT